MPVEVGAPEGSDGFRDLTVVGDFFLRGFQEIDRELHESFGTLIANGFGTQDFFVTYRAVLSWLGWRLAVGGVGVRYEDR